MIGSRGAIETRRIIKVRSDGSIARASESHGM
jgi:hypothetical protein